MSVAQMFPKTVEEFMEEYKMVDKDHVYSNGIEYVPIFRMKQWFEHISSVQPEIIRCKDCEYWRQQTNYAGTPLSFGFCESDDMWRSLYGETTEVAHIDTDDNHYCSYAERRLTDG